MIYQAEMTDTFNGDANYSWVRRVSFEAPDDATDRTLVTRAKRELDITGVRCTRDDWQDTLVLRPAGAAIVVFITWDD